MSSEDSRKQLSGAAAHVGDAGVNTEVVSCEHRFEVETAEFTHGTVEVFALVGMGLEVLPDLGAEDLPERRLTVAQREVQ